MSRPAPPRPRPAASSSTRAGTRTPPADASLLGVDHPGEHVLCTNPAALGGGSGPITPIFTKLSSPGSFRIERVSALPLDGVSRPLHREVRAARRSRVAPHHADPPQGRHPSDSAGGARADSGAARSRREYRARDARLARRHTGARLAREALSRFRPVASLGWRAVGLHETLIVETEAAFTILGLLLVFLPMFLTVLARAESSDTTMYGSRVLVVALAWSVPVLIVVAGLDATFGLFAI